MKRFGDTISRIYKKRKGSVKRFFLYDRGSGRLVANMVAMISGNGIPGKFSQTKRWQRVLLGRKITLSSATCSRLGTWTGLQ